MYPTLISLGPFSIHTYGVFVAIAALTGLLVTVKLGKSYGFGSQKVMDMGFIIVAAAIVGSRLLYVAMNLTFYAENPLDVFKIWQGGLVFSGGIVLVLASMGWYALKNKISLLQLGDLWSPAAALAQAVGRIGCFMAGCCYGKPTDLKWGVIFTHPETLAPPNVLLHPTQIYSSVSGFLLFIILIWMHAKKKFRGQIFLWFLILHSTARLGLENFRGDNRGALMQNQMTVTQLVTLVILFTAIAFLIYLKSKNKKDG